MRTYPPEHYAALESKFRDLMPLLADVFSQGDAKDIQDYADANEFGLAFDLLCFIVAKEGKPIAAATYHLLSELGSQMLLDPKTWEPIKQFVRPPH